MPDATEWLVEWIDRDSEARYDHIADRDHAIESLRGLVVRGISATLYQRVPFEVQIGVTVKSPRRRRKKEAKEGAAPSDAPSEGQDSNPPPVERRTASNLASPVFPWTCEARFDGDPECPCPAEFDAVTRGWFCPLHLTAIGLAGRLELHRKHASRNRPVRVAHAG